MNGIIFCVCLILAIFVLQIVLKWCRKERKKDSGEERVTAKSKPMMNLFARCSERTPAALSSAASESPAKTRHESQTLLSSQTERYDRTGRPVVCAHSSSYSEWNTDKTWSSQEWKSDELMDDRTERPVVCSQGTNSVLKTMRRILTPKLNQNCCQDPDHSCTGWMIKCKRDKNNPQKMQPKTATNILWYEECLCLPHCQHQYSWQRIIWKIFIPSKIQEKISQWNRCSTYLKSWQPNNQMRSMEWKQLTGKTLHGSICLWLVMNKSSVSCTQRSRFFRILYCALERWTRTLNQTLHGNKRLGWFQNISGIQRLGQNWWWANGTRVKHLPRIQHIAGLPQRPRVIVKIERNTRNLMDGSSSCRCSTTSHGI